jgi:hypothetical protein
MPLPGPLDGDPGGGGGDPYAGSDDGDLFAPGGLFGDRRGLNYTPYNASGVPGNGVTDWSSGPAAGSGSYTRNGNTFSLGTSYNEDYRWAPANITDAGGTVRITEGGNPARITSPGGYGVYGSTPPADNPFDLPRGSSSLGQPRSAEDPYNPYPKNIPDGARTYLPMTPLDPNDTFTGPQGPRDVYSEWFQYNAEYLRNIDRGNPDLYNTYREDSIFPIPPTRGSDWTSPYQINDDGVIRDSRLIPIGFPSFASGGNPEIGKASRLAERGYEIAIFGGNATVLPHELSQEILGSGGGAAPNVTVIGDGGLQVSVAPQSGGMSPSDVKLIIKNTLLDDLTKRGVITTTLNNRRGGVSL